MKTVSRYILGTALGLVMGFASAKASDDSVAIHVKAHKEALSKYKEQAVNYCAKNLNRFGLYELQKYDVALDSLYKQEVNDTLKAFRTNYDKSHSSRNYTLGLLNSQISTLSKQKEDAQKLFNKLLKKASIASLIWLVIVIILIQIRSRSLKKIQIKLDHAKLQLQLSEQNVVLGKELLLFAKAQHSKLNVIQKINADIQTDFTGTNEQPEETKNSMKSILTTASLNQKLVTATLSLENEAGTEKVPSNLNQLCDQCMDTVYHGLNQKDETFHCTIAKDLEKNLPSIKVVPEAVNYLLMNVLNNAFQSVYEKHQRGVKGYAPKVSISTRVLPRFLQIRVKDNGGGMTDEVIGKIYDPFYTVKEGGKESGLGMYFTKKIISEIHKGEIKIESHIGDGTDVYLKFFTA